MFKKVALFAAMAWAFAQPAQATLVNLTPDGNWNAFDVDAFTAASGGLEWIDLIDGSPLSFSFTLPSHGILTVVDGGFAGDKFKITVNGIEYSTSTPVDSYPNSVGLDFDAALADNQYSALRLDLAAGTYTVTGLLSQSAQDGSGNDINATVGGIKAVIPVAPTWALLGLGAGLLPMFNRRRWA